MFDWYEAEVQALERARVTLSPPSGAVVFYGSSSLRLWPELASAVGICDAVNLGFGGSTLAACAWFFERLVLPYNPRAIVFYAGDNDLGDGQSCEAVVGSFRTLLDKVDRYCGPIPFAFISIKPSPARWPIISRIRRTNAAIRQELAWRTASHYIDVFTPMLDTEGRPRHKLFVEDGLHLSEDGYQLWAEIVADYRHVIC